jgi:hypothetical protein
MRERERERERVIRETQTTRMTKKVREAYTFICMYIHTRER